ncbi:MAG: DUF3786 domain-containing protein [Thermodesulfobacteriota bacterium]
MAKNPVFDETYQKYLARFAELDLKSRAPLLGVTLEDGCAVVPFFTQDYRVSADGVFSPEGTRPIHAISVVLLKYFILCPESLPEDRDWVSYRDFRDAAPFAGAFARNTERAIADNFSGDAQGLSHACSELGAISADHGNLSYDVAMQVYALPAVPLLVLFNDRDEEFAASCSVLFEKRAGRFLDMECLAILGWLLSDYLEAVRGRETKSGMV